MSRQLSLVSRVSLRSKGASASTAVEKTKDRTKSSRRTEGEKGKRRGRRCNHSHESLLQSMSARLLSNSSSWLRKPPLAHSPLMAIAKDGGDAQSSPHYMTRSSGYSEDSEIRMVASSCRRGKVRKGWGRKGRRESARGADVDVAVRQPGWSDEGSSVGRRQRRLRHGRSDERRERRCWSKEEGRKGRERRCRNRVKGRPVVRTEARYETILIADAERRNDGRLHIGVALGIQFDPVPRIERRFLVRRGSGEGLRWSRRC